MDDLATSGATPSMAPLVYRLLRRQTESGPASGEFRKQWTTPSDVFTVLLIVGGDVVARALAQLVGSSFTPVAFSFGEFPADHQPAIGIAV
jgi:hypothetical protein